MKRTTKQALYGFCGVVILLQTGCPDPKKFAEYFKPDPPPCNSDDLHKCDALEIVNLWSPKKETEQAAAAAGYLLKLNFFANPTPVARKPAHGDLAPILSTAVGRNVQYRSILEILTGNVVFARIEAKANGPEERLYGIGGRQNSEGWLDTFYVIIHNFNWQPKGKDLIQVADWKIMGIRKVGDKYYAQQTGNTGKFYLCVGMHPDDIRHLGSKFISCPNVTKSKDAYGHAEKLPSTEATPASILPSVFEILDETARSQNFGAQTASVQVTQQVRASSTDSFAIALNDVLRKYGYTLPMQYAKALGEVWVDEPTDPLWMTCGLGCCNVGEALPLK